MPMTAVLSRTLHEALGDEAAADLVDWIQQVDTHRAELRELNELNYARLDSRLSEVRHELRTEIVTLRMEMHDGFADIRGEMRGGFAAVDAKIERRFADLVKWSFLFWCGAVAAAILARR